MALPDSPADVYLVRHGAVVGAEVRRFIGDVLLSPLGEAQCRALAAGLRDGALGQAATAIREREDGERTRR